MKNIIKILILSSLLTGCDDLFKPAIENNLGFEYMYGNAGYAEGVLSNAYTRIPNASYSFNDVATDDAVSNDASNSYRKMVTGAWQSDNDPTERWRNCRAAIQYLNLFLANADNVHWANDELAAKMYNDRLKGEAYGLRSMYMYYLLQAHGGWTADGKLLGVPIVTEPEGASTDFNYARATFDECMKALYADAKRALELLPTDYGDGTSNSEIPSKYLNEGVNLTQYNRVFGVKFRGRISGRIVEAIRSQAALLAASPAFSKGTTTSWQDAADYAAGVLDRINGVAGIDADGGTWYSNKEIASLGSGECPPEILWRGTKSSSNSLESDNYPPSIYGKGRINPTQNLVDAFPMLNGYPISTSDNSYKANPYANRDPRLATYILYNGMKAGVNDKVITTAADGTTNDALDKEEGHSTRTGYYMRKLLRQDINLDPNVNSTQEHYQARIRYTEIYLNYAEAANEAFGPQGKGSHAYSAYDVIKAIRSRAGITGGDLYLESIKDDKDKMREQIRNERRLELCFEGFRFWDLRRWKANWNTTAKGVSITGDATKTYSPIEVETRTYKDYMYYGPIPYSEILKFSALEQNQGW